MYHVCLCTFPVNINGVILMSPDCPIHGKRLESEVTTYIPLCKKCEDLRHKLEIALEVIDEVQWPDIVKEIKEALKI